MYYRLDVDTVSIIESTLYNSLESILQLVAILYASSFVWVYIYFNIYLGHH